MEADWYVDPLGRYEGRFFDGEAWTERVSDNGVLAIDPLWPPVDSEADNEVGPATGGLVLVSNEDAEVAELADDGNAEVTNVDVRADSEGSTDRLISLDFADPVDFGSAAQPALPAIETSGVNFDDNAVERPAVQGIDRGADRKATLVHESPVRTVAVVDETLYEAERQRPSRRWLRWLLPLLLFALVALAFYFLTRSSDVGEGSAADLDATQEDRVEDLEAGVQLDEIDPSDLEPLEVEATDDDLESDSDVPLAVDEMIDVGGLRIVNGKSVLFELEDWHQSFASSRGVELPPDAQCWFGRLGEAAVTTATCGPVGGSAETEFLYDIVPLRFLDIGGGQLAQPALDEVMTDEVISPTLELIGSTAGLVPGAGDQDQAPDDGQAAEDEPVEAADALSTDNGMEDLPAEESQRGERIGN